MSEEAPPPRADVANLAQRYDRLALGQLLLGLAAIVISAAALWTSYVQADATRKTQEASVLPAIQLDVLIDDTFTQDRASVIVQLDNVGVGPARIHSWRALVNGQPLDEATLFSALPPEVEAADYTFSAMQNRMLALGPISLPLGSIFQPSKRTWRR